MHKYSYLYFSADCEYFCHLCSFGARSPDTQLADSPPGPGVHTWGDFSEVWITLRPARRLHYHCWETLEYKHSHLYMIMTSNWREGAWEIIRLRMQMRDPFSLRFPFARGLLSQSCERKKKLAKQNRFKLLPLCLFSLVSRYFCVFLCIDQSPCFQKGNPAPPTHATLDGISPRSPAPSLDWEVTDVVHRTIKLTGRVRELSCPRRPHRIAVFLCL